MIDIRFYHLRPQGITQALPKLLLMTLARNQRAILRFGSQENMQFWDQHLWTFDPQAFLPHGIKNDPKAAEQPILLTTDYETLNSARYEFLLDGLTFQQAEQLMSAILFSDDQQEQVESARVQWKALTEKRKQGDQIQLSYWQQDGDGRWQQKA